MGAGIQRAARARPFGVALCCAVVAVSSLSFDPKCCAAEGGPASARVSIRIAEGYGRPYALPGAGQLRVDNGPWRPIALPYLQIQPDARRAQFALRIKGYVDPAPRMVDFVSGSTIDVVFDLVPLPATVTIACNVPAARIYENGDEIGRAAEPLHLTAFRDHRLLVKAPNYRDETLVLRQIDPTIDDHVYQVDLQRLPGDVVVTATCPVWTRRNPRAEIFVDGTCVATAALPYVIMGLTKAEVSVGIRLPGFKPVDPRLVRVTPGHRTTVEFPVDHVDAYFEFDIMPPDARVLFGNWVLTTNRMRIVPDLLYTIRVDAPNYVPVSLVQAATAGETRVIHIALVPRTYLRFELTPPEAVVFMSGRRITARLVEVKPGIDHRLDIRAPHCKPQVVTVTPTQGETRVISVDLKRRTFDF